MSHKDYHTSPDASAKLVKNKLWFLNSVIALMTLGAFSVMVTGLCLGWSAGVDTVFGMITTAGFAWFTKEATVLLDLQTSKYRKDHGLARMRQEITNEDNSKTSMGSDKDTDPSDTDNLQEH